MNDLAAETLVSLKAVTRRYSPPLHLNTVRRWERVGIRGVKLRTLMVGGRVYTSEQELTRFRRAVEVARERQRRLPEHLRLPRPAAVARRAHERAAKFLGRPA